MLDYWKNYWNGISTIVDEQSQVGRTVKKVPIANDAFQRCVNWVAEKMLLDKNSTLLELCCGNGVWTIPLSKRVKHIYAVDFSEPLVKALRGKRDNADATNVDIILQDVADIFVNDYSHCSHVLMYFAIQHFSEREALFLFEKIYKILRNTGHGGIFYIGDIPDRQKLWDYANTAEYEKIYFDNLKNEAPAIGTWFMRDDLMRMARYIGFSKCEIICQPQWQINSKYRFDMKLVV